MHPVEKAKQNKTVQRMMSTSSSTRTNQPAQSSSDENNGVNLTMRKPSHRTATDKRIALKVTSSTSFFEGYRSETSINTIGYMDIENTNNTYSDLIVFMHTEPSIMFYSSVFLMVRH